MAAIGETIRMVQHLNEIIYLQKMSKLFYLLPIDIESMSRTAWNAIHSRGFE